MEIELGQMFFGNKWEDHEAPLWLGEDIYRLSQILGERRPEAQRHGLLGDEWGYGQHYVNDVFEMHPYHWGECECGFDEREQLWESEHPHAPDCYQTAIDALRRQGAGTRKYKTAVVALCAGRGLTYPEGSEVHCTCTHDADYARWREGHGHVPTCPVVLPNFRHKRTGLAVHWYKYIGRSMTMSAPIGRTTWRQVFAECLASLGVAVG